jgi:hypothetical protein
MRELDLTELSFGIIAFLGVLLPIYGLLSSSERIKPVLIIIGVILLAIYAQWFVRKYLTKEIEETNKNMAKKMGLFNEKIEDMKNEISYIKGWINAINHKKNKKGAINPITLIAILIILIVLILYSQGKL